MLMNDGPTSREYLSPVLPGPALVHRFQGALLGTALAMQAAATEVEGEDRGSGGRLVFSRSLWPLSLAVAAEADAGMTEQPGMTDQSEAIAPSVFAWWQRGQAIAQCLVDGTLVPERMLSQLSDLDRHDLDLNLDFEQSDGADRAVTLWSRGLDWLPAVLVSSDRLMDGTIVGLLPSEQASRIWPYALVPLTLTALLHPQGMSHLNLEPRSPSSLHRGLHPLLARLLALIHAQEPSSQQTERMLSYCVSLLHHVQWAFDEAPGTTVMLQKLRPITAELRTEFNAEPDTVAAATSPGSKLVSPVSRAIADGVILVLMLHCMLATPGDVETTLQRFARQLRHPEIDRFEDMKPYIKSVRGVAIATLGALIGADQSRLRLPIFFPSLGSPDLTRHLQDSQMPNNLAADAGLAAGMDVSLMVWGTRLWALWSGLDPWVCRRLGSAAQDSTDSELIDPGKADPELKAWDGIGVTASPNVIRVFGD